MLTRRKLKKGVMSASFIVGTVITLVAFVIIGGTVARFMGEAEPKEAEIMCHDSVALRANSMITVEHTLLKAEIKPVPVLCKTIDYKIKGDKEKLMEQIAQKMARAWWMFNEGRYEEILSGSKFNVLFFGTDKITNDCFMSYALMIDEKEIEGTEKYPAEGKITAEEFADYFRNNKYPKLNITYLNYFQSYGGPGRVGFLVPEGLLPNHAYGISFLAKNAKKETGFWEGAGKIAAGIGVAALGIATGGVGFIVFTGAVAVSLGATGVNNLKAYFYKSDRDVSAVYLDNLKSAQEKCFHGDLGGE